MAPLFGRKKDAPARADRVSLADQAGEERVVDAHFKSKIAIGLAMVGVFLVLLEFIFPAAVPGRGPELTVGQVAREDIVAPYDFDVLKSEEELQAERELAAAGVVAVYRFDEEILAEQRRRLGDFLSKIYGIRTGAEPTRQKREMLGQLEVTLSDTTRQILTARASAESVEERARAVLNILYEKGMLRTRGAQAGPSDQTVMLVRGDEESLVNLGDFQPVANISQVVYADALDFFEDRARARAVEEIVVPFLRGNVVHDTSETERRRHEAMDSVDEFTGRDFKKDEVIIERGERVTTEHVTIVRSMDVKGAALLNMESGPARFFPSLGRILEALLLLGSLVLYLSVRRGSMLLSRRCQVLFMVLIVIVMVAAASVRGLTGVAPYLVPIAVLAMLASMLFDFEVAIISTVITVLLAGMYSRFGIPFVLISTVAGVVAAHSVRQVRHREDFYMSAIKVVVAYAVAIAVADIWKVDLGLATLTRCGWGGLNAVVSMGIVVVTLPLFERGFRVTTDITLLELADMNKPLLRKMAMSSPGTYHHSIVVGNLAEAAAKAIGANGLLTRVASYYHDIGKLVDPGYFVENQQGLDPKESRHTGLKPKVSSLVIRAHVKDGVKLARKEGLPEPLIDVIREHHGTSVMEYFYNKALEESDGSEEITEADYSYPGPRPRSKESAIIALADTIEARVRSIGDSLTPKRIEAEVDEVMERRWRDHQLDDAELTLSDLRKIREAFFRVLVGMYHQRIKYPGQDEWDGRERRSTGPVPVGTPVETPGDDEPVGPDAPDTDLLEAEPSDEPTAESPDGTDKGADVS
jgi:putative nucleotidyltransferase with HDIG domain